MKVAELKVGNPYVGPRPFEVWHQRRFFGRDWEADELVALVVTHPAVLLYAQSGAGKTSLINAKLIPMLKDQEGLEVMPVARVRGEIPEEVRPQQIKNLFVFNTLLDWMESGADPTQLVGLSLSAFLQGKPRPKDEEEQPTLRVIIFDQFEELFTLYPERWPEREGFFAQVADALAQDPFLRVLFVMREDYLAQLDPYVELLPERLRTRFRLERLRREAALVAIKGPLVGTERSFAPGVAESLVEELLKIRVETRAGETVEVPGEFVEPVQLQVVCRSLWDELPLETKEITLVGAKPVEVRALEKPAKVTEITLEHLRIFGNVDHALLGFYERALSSTSQQAEVREGELRDWFERDLITPMGTRGTVYRGMEFTGGIPNAAIDVLESQHLIRPELRAGARWYELTHDRFIGPIQRSNEAWRAVRRRWWLRIGGGIAAVLVLLFVGIMALLTNRSTQKVAQFQATATVAAARASEAKATATMIAAELSEAKALRPGISVGGVESTAGTIGGFVMDADGELYLLSAANVLGEPDYELETAVLQPGPTDGGQAPDDVIGYFAEYLPLDDGVSVANLAGLARLEDGIKFETAIPGLGPIRGVRDPVLGLTVYKMGRTTGLTTGQVTQIDMMFSMAIDKETTLQFTDGIYCSLESEAGDSGALVVDDEGYAIGIVVGSSREETILAPMQKVLDSLDVQLLHSGAVRVWERDDSEIVYVPAGEFTMGSDDSNSLAGEDEKPPRSVYLDAFWMDRTEVTNAAFARFVGETGYQTEVERAGESSTWMTYAEGKDNHPAVKVTWKDADTYCRWAGKRLPTEAEWEKAARGKEGFIYPWGNEWDPTKVHAKESGLKGTVAVGSFPEGASPYSVFDMAGNVWEWTADWYLAYPGSTYQSKDLGEKLKVTRGGGWFQEANMVTTSNRSATDPRAANDDLGFRCAESPAVAEVGLWLAEGCDQEYQPGSSMQIFFWATVDGQVAVWLDEQELLFEREVIGGETPREDWQVVGEPGEHRLTAVLDLGQERLVHSGECRFLVKSPIPIITPSPTPIIAPSVTPTAIPTPPPTFTSAPTPTPTPALTGKIAFTLWDGARYNVWVANVDGSDRAMIIGAMRQPAFSRDGSKIVVNGEAPDRMDLHVIDADGSNLTALSRYLEDSRPSWSPDGARVVFDSTRYGDGNSRIYILDDVTKRTEGRVLRSADSDTFGRDPFWLPDGRIVYKGCDYWAGGANCGLYIVPSDGSAIPTQLTTDANDMAPTAHGNKVAFMSDRDGNKEIYSINTDGTNLKRLTNNDVNDGLPTFSPDGRFIAFVSDEGGKWAIWVMNADGSGRRRLFGLDGGYGSGEYDWTTERISWASYAAPEETME